MAGSVGLFGVGVSGLQVANRALATVGNNIANVNTEGYSRQRVDIASRPPQLQGGSFVGAGADVVNTRRLFDGFATQQLRLSTAGLGYADAYYELSGVLDNLLADADTGLNGPLQGFFDAVQDLASDPASGAARQALLGEAEGLATRFHTLDRAFADLDEQVGSRIESVVAEVNVLSEAIAALNHDIQVARGQAGGRAEPNSLLDQRDELLRQLSQKVNVTVVEQDDGALNVFTGSGQALVLGSRASDLAAVAGEYDPTRLEVAYQGQARSPIISSRVSGGELGALLEFRSRVLDPSRNALGRVALGLTETFNDQHGQGVDLQGRVGAAFFRPLDGTDALAPVEVRGHAENAGDASLAVQVTDVSRLTTSDYLLERSGGTYTLRRLSDGSELALPGFPAGPVTLESEGLQLEVTAGGLADGDQFLIRPTRTAAGQVEVAIDDPLTVAAGGLVTTAAAGAGNTGTAAVSAAAWVPGTTLPSPATLTLTYDATAGAFDAGAFGSFAYDPATGATYTLGGLGVSLSGTPGDGDTFMINTEAGGPGDNRNALALAGLASEGVLESGTATYADAYGALVVRVGTVTRQAEVNRTAQRTLLDEATRVREAAAGVNLDEEAADLLRFQQSYQASAQVIAAASFIFDTLLQAVAR
jgi:flagellar hook-associated protein 1 FlgK